MKKLLAIAVLSIFGAISTPAMATCVDTFAQIQALINADIVAGVPGGIRASTVNTIMNIQNSCYLNIKSYPSASITAFGITPNTVGGFATWPTSMTVGGSLNDVFTAGGADNASAAATWTTGTSKGTFTLGPSPAGNQEYYFSSSVDLISPGLNLDCGGGGFRADPVSLTFAAGVDGVIEDVGSRSDVSGCTIRSLGVFLAANSVASGNPTLIHIVGLSGSTLTVPFFAPGDGVIAKGGSGADAALLTPPGAYVQSVGSGSITLPTAFAPTSTPANGNASLFRLPAALAQSATIVSGSPAVVITSGSYKWVSGDLIWSDAFPLGATVYTASGSVGAQTLQIYDAFMSQSLNATVSHAAGSGQVWMIPSSFKRRNTGESHNVYTIGFFTGMQMSCNSPGSINCTNSTDYNFSNENSAVGRWVSGDNTGASTSYNGLYTGNYRYTVFELGDVGSSYYGEGYNSAEYGSALEDVVLNCKSDNLSHFSGFYSVQTNAVGGCADITDPYNTNPPVQSPFGKGASLILNVDPVNDPIPGTPVIQGNRFYGAPFQFGNGGGTGDCMFFAGGDSPIYSQTSPSVYVLTSWWNHTCGINFNKGIDGGYYGLLGYMYSNSTTTKPLFVFTDPTVYTKYGSGATNYWSMLPTGFLLDNQTDVGVAGTERMIDLGAAAPAYTTSLQGDFRYNNGLAAGGTLGWCNTASGAHWFICGPISNQAAVPDYTAQAWRLTPVAIGSLPTCTGGLVETMAVNNGVTVATSGYGVAVSTTGSAVRKVFCDGSSGWVYD